jgi:hypothetical protein
MILLEKALGELTPLVRVRQELHASVHGEATDRALGRRGLGRDRYPRIALQAVHLRQAVDADHEERVRRVHEPHRRGLRGPVGAHHGQDHDLSGAQEGLDLLVSETFGRAHAEGLVMCACMTGILSAMTAACRV